VSQIVADFIPTELTELHATGELIAGDEAGVRTSRCRARGATARVRQANRRIRLGDRI
jgi:hypothetical protein